jgi:glutamine amidotransferase
MQLLMSESTEFGVNRGLGVIEGDTVRLDGGVSVDQSPVKVPHIGWNRIFAPSTGKSVNPWSGSMLNGVPEAEHFYFVHSYNVRPADQRLILCTTRYGAYEFCSGLRLGNVHAFQFHPERSGPQGLAIYANLAAKILGTNAATS